MENFGFVPVMAIVVLAFLVGSAWKTASRLDDKWIPIVCGVVGLILGVIGRNVIDGFPATDTITAAAIGTVSGLAATGVHQAFKQQVKEVDRLTGGDEK